MDKDEDLKDAGGGGGEKEKTQDNDDKSSDIIEIKDDSSQDGGKASPIAAESPSGSRWGLILTNHKISLKAEYLL